MTRVDEAKAKANAALENARHQARKAQLAAEEALEDAKHEIVKHPFEAVALSFGMGIALGSLAVWMYRNGKR